MGRQSAGMRTLSSFGRHTRIRRLHQHGFGRTEGKHITWNAWRASEKRDARPDGSKSEDHATFKPLSWLSTEAIMAGGLFGEIPVGRRLQRSRCATFISTGCGGKNSRQLRSAFPR